MTRAREPRIIELARRWYFLWQRIETGATSFVWKAIDVTGLDRHPELFEPVGGSDREKLEHLRSFASSAPVALPEDYEKVSPERHVALKVAREGKEAKLQEEARNLAKFKADSWHRSRKAQVVRVRADLTARPGVGLPILVEDWVHGDPLDEADPYDESRGFPIILQLVEMVEGIWATKNLVATDSIKPNSLIWNSELLSLFLIDWGIVGRGSVDMSDQAFPLLANTIYRLLTGQTIEFDDAFRANPLTLGKGAAERWERLTYGTKAIIRRALFRGFPDPDPHVLREAARAQWDLWGKEGEELLALASTEKGESALNAYDLAMLRQQSLSEEERERNLQELYEVIEEGTIADRHDDVLFDLSWARLRYPRDPYLRRAWLAHRAGRSAPFEAWGLLKEGLASLKAGAYEPALEAMRQAESLVASREPEALILEAEIELGLAKGEQRLERAFATKLRTDFKKLSDLWKGQGWEDDAALRDLGDRMGRHAERVDRMPTLREQAIGRLDARDYEGALEKIRELSELWPAGPDFDYWEEGIIALREERGDEVLSIVRQLSLPDEPIAHRLDDIAVETHIRGAEEAALQDDYQEARRLAKVVADHRRQDEQLQLLVREYHKRATAYEAAMAEIDRARSESFRAEIDALNRALGQGFRYDRQRQALGPRRYECQVTLAERYSEQGELGQALMEIKEALDGLTALGEEMDPAGIDPGVDLEAMRSRAEKKRRGWLDLRRKKADKRLAHIPTLFRDTEMPVDYVVKESIRVCQEVLKDDPGSPDADSGVDAIRAFRRGMYLLMERQYGEAHQELAEAEDLARTVDDWDDKPIKNRISPYLEFAAIGARLERIGQSGEVEFNLVAATEAFVVRGELEDRLAKWGEQHGKGLVDDWLKREYGRLAEQIIPRSRERARRSLHDLIEHGLSTHGGLDAADGRAREWYYETSKALEAGLARLKELEPAAQAGFVRAGVRERRLAALEGHPLSRENLLPWLDERNRRVHALYNYDLARALVLKAAVWSGQGREDIADTRLAWAAQAAKVAEEQEYTGPWPEGRQPREELSDETERYLRPVWEATNDKPAIEDYTDLVRWLRQGFQRLEELEGLKELGDLMLSRAAREQMEQALEELFTLEGDEPPQKAEAAAVVARYKPADLRSTLYHYDLLAALVNRGFYTEASELAEEVERLHGHRVASAPALSDARKRLSDEIYNQLCQYWQQIVAGATAPGQLGDRLMQGLRQLDPDLRSLAVAFPRAPEPEGGAAPVPPPEVWSTGSTRRHPAAETLRKYLRTGNHENLARDIAQILMKEDTEMENLRKHFAQTLAEDYRQEVNALVLMHDFLPWGWPTLFRACKAGRRLGVLAQIPLVAQQVREHKRRERWAFLFKTVGSLVSIALLIFILGIIVRFGPRLQPLVVGMIQPSPTPPLVPAPPSPASPTPTVLPPVAPIQVKLTIGEADLREAGTEVWREVRVSNVGSVTATVYLATDPALDGLVLCDSDSACAADQRLSMDRGQWAVGELPPGGQRELWVRIFRRSVSEPEDYFRLIARTEPDIVGGLRVVRHSVPYYNTIPEVTIAPINGKITYSVGTTVTFTVASDFAGTYIAGCRLDEAGVTGPTNPYTHTISIEPRTVMTATGQISPRVGCRPDQGGFWLIEVCPRPADDNPYRDDLVTQPISGTFTVKVTQ